MLRLHRDRVVQISSPLIESLTRQSGDQIKAYVFKTRIAKVLKSVAGISRVVAASEKFKFAIVKSLHAKARAVDAKIFVSCQSFWSNRCRIHLHSDLRVKRYVELMVDGGENLFDLFRR